LHYPNCVLCVQNFHDLYTERPIFVDYEDLASKPFFPGLIKYMLSGPVVAIVVEGLDAVKTGRAMLGATNPLASSPGRCTFVLSHVCNYNDGGFRYYPW
jgi:nucleoside diphosphate kinase